jgi:predicted NAD-dependent protein-ADP-ribosyltransferase YbiA (DUF1768 family)
MHSLSEDYVMLSKFKKQKHPKSIDTIGRNKRPSHCEAGKHMKKVSERRRAAVDELNPQQQHFFSSNFVGKT